MAEFSFLGTWEDSWHIVTSIFLLGDVSMVPDCYYTRPEPIMFDSLSDEFKKTAFDRRRFFLLSKAYSTQPLLLTRQNMGVRAGQYFITGTKGGPCLDLTLPACYVENDLTFLNFGVLSYAREYFDVMMEEWGRPSRELKNAYKNTVSHIKKHLVRRATDNTIWIGKNANELLECGRARIVGQGLREG